MSIFRVIGWSITLVCLAVAGLLGYQHRDRLMSLLSHAEAPHDEGLADEVDQAAPFAKVVLNEMAQGNLGIRALPLKPGSYWKTITVPGMVVDRPGFSDRGVVAPATGIVTRVHHFPGEMVRSGDILFTLRLSSETLHQTQTDLFKSMQDIALAREQRKRLADSAGAIPEARIIEADNQITRLQVACRAYSLELVNRGFTPEMVASVESGKFVGEVVVTAPNRNPKPLGTAGGTDGAEMFEVQELKVELGHQVQSGQVMCLLSNHENLLVEGRAFRDETALLERSVREKWPVSIDFQERTTDWGELNQEFRIRHLANMIDPATRTFAFQVPLTNQSRVVMDEGRSQTLWRFRPGQRVRIDVRIERLDNVFVVPAEAVAQDGAEAYIFSQNVNTFERLPVRVLARDRRLAVLANDGSIVPGTFVAQGAAAQLNRLAKAGTSGGAPKGYHIHADGSLHKNGDEGR